VPPAFTLSLFQMTLVLRLVRSQMPGVLRADHIEFARARGLTDRAVQFADIPVMAAYLVMVSFIFVAIDFFVDLLHAAIDPRLRLDRAQLGTAGGRA
jgi:peptide/nickel transport system permease protein